MDNNLSKQYDSNDEIRAKTLASVMRRFSPFDGTGVDLRGAGNYGDALKSAGLDFGIEQRAVRVGGGPFEGRTLSRYRVNLRSDTGEDLGIVTTQYKPILHRDAFTVAETLKDGGYADYETGGIGRGSKNAADSSTGFLLMRHADAEIEGEQYQSFSYLRNTFDGSGGLSMKFVVVRLVCMNGLAREFQTGVGNIVIRHTKSIDEKKKLAEQIMIRQDEYVRSLKAEAAKLLNIKMSRAEFQSP
ncbi:MAG: DUF945 domain-containing protein [Clostridiales bacterium]|nr:DUF945 domain-containing protein [Clostridiales bacterium]